MAVSRSSTKAQIEVVNPVAEVRPEAIMPAPRLNDLNGKEIALWWNMKSHGDVALAAVAELLENRFQGMKFVRFTQGYPHGSEVYDPVLESGCDAAIASTGD